MIIIPDNTYPRRVSGLNGAAIHHRGCAGGVLFISKKFTGHKGLGWNAWHTCNVLRAAGVRAAWVQTNSDLAKIIALHQPRVVIVQALWIPLETLAELAASFPDIHFVVKNHSGPQFLAQEPMGWRWLCGTGDIGKRYGNVSVSAIKPEDVAALRAMNLLAIELPNVYSPDELAETPRPAKLPGLHVGLFGAYRPLKNAVGMALGVSLASSRTMEAVTLHVNGTRMEMGAPNDGAIIRDICRRAGVELIEHGWLEHEPFKQLAGSMSVCVAASFSETFNYVAADCITAGTPVVGSDAIFWLPQCCRVNPDSTDAIATALLAAPQWPVVAALNSLRAFNAAATRRLLSFLACLGIQKHS